MNKKKIIALLAIAAAVLGCVYYYRMQVADDTDPFAEYKAAMQRDDVGGATPRDTLRMFISALRANDDVAAARLFMLDDNLSRAKWEARLADLKLRGMLVKMADDIEKNAKATKPAYEGDAGYELLTDSGVVREFLDMEFNKFSGVWKLQSL